MRVAVVGGGIGGLAAANAMVRQGIDVTVYEQARALGEVGAGVLITPNSVRHVDRWGLWSDLDRLGGRITTGSVYRRSDGTEVGPIRTSDSAGRYGVYGLHRADLLSLFAGALPDAVVQTGRRCVAFEQSVESAVLTFDDGSQVEADVVVAADGIHSVLRDHVCAPASPVFSGMVAYRGLVDADRLPSWRRDVHQVWMGEGKHFMVFPVRGGDLLNFVGFVPSDRPAEESWSGIGDVEELRAAFAGWHAPVSELLSAVEEPFWWGLFDREPLPTWTNGRLTLLGDAAHAMLPHLGQGANQSVEDAVALAATLHRDGEADVFAALASYERLRRPRAIAVQEGARANGRRYDSQYEDLSSRDAEIASAGDLRAWLYDYDVEQDLASTVAAASAP